MRRFMFCVVLAAAFASSFAGTLTERQRKFLRRRFLDHEERTCRDDGAIVVVRWYTRGGKPDGAETNVLHAVTGRIQNNALRNQLETMRTDLVDKIERLRDATNRVNALTADRSRIVGELTQLRDRAALKATKEVYQALIDRLEGSDR